MRERRGDVLGRELDRHLPDLGLAGDPAAEVQFVVRRHVRAHAFPDTVQPDGGDVVLRARIVAPADLHRHVPQVLRHPSGREDLDERAGQPFGGGDAQPARIGAGAGDDVLDQFGAGVAQVHRDQALVEVLDPVGGDPADAQVLLDRGPDVPVGKFVDQVGHFQHLRGGDVAHGEPDKDGRESRLPLRDDVRPLPHVEGRFGAAVTPVAFGRPVSAVGADRLDQLWRDVEARRQGQATAFMALARHGEFHFDAALELFEAQLFDDELHPRLVAVLPVAEVVEDLQDRLAERQQVLHRQELIEKVRDARCGAQPAACRDAEADGPVCLLDRQEAEVVNGSQGAIVLAAGEGDLELARQALVERVAQEVRRDRLGVGRHVEDLPLADAGQMARGHVPDGVAAGLAGGHPDFGQAAHDRPDVLERGEVQLNVLARRDVADAGGIAVGHLGDDPELRGVEAPEGNLDADHMHAGLALAVDPVLKAEGPEQVLGQCAAKHLRGLVLERLDLPEYVGGDRSRCPGPCRWRLHDCRSSDTSEEV